MKAMVLDSPGSPLEWREVGLPEPGFGQLLVKVSACAVCRTDLHVLDGELAYPKLPIIPGHEIVGDVVALGHGESVDDAYQVGGRVGIPWLGWTCGVCNYCSTGRENLCDQAKFTGYTLDGGYAEYVVADARYCFPLATNADAARQAPLLCAGLIGYRCLTKAGDAHRIGLFGFGAAAHIIIQVACHQGREVYAFTKPGDAIAQSFARQLGAVWAGASDDSPPHPLDAAIIFAPAGELVPTALRHVVKGGTVVCGGIHMSDIPAFPYADLWGERSLCSVANLTRSDGEAFLRLAPQVPLQIAITRFPLEAANEALSCLRQGLLKGAAVLVP